MSHLCHESRGGGREPVRLSRSFIGRGDFVVHVVEEVDHRRAIVDRRLSLPVDIAAEKDERQSFELERLLVAQIVSHHHFKVHSVVEREVDHFLLRGRQVAKRDESVRHPVANDGAPTNRLQRRRSHHFEILGALVNLNRRHVFVIYDGASLWPYKFILKKIEK